MFKNLAIKWKLVILAGSLLLMTMVMGIAGYVGSQKIGQSMHEIGDVRLPSVDGLLMLSEAQTAVKAAALSTLLHENNYSAQQKFTEVLNERKGAWAKAEAGWKKYEPLPQTAEEAVLWK